MPEQPVPEVTRLLLAWRAGERAALDRLVPVVYEELRRMAHARMRAESPGRHTLQTTGLVHEAFVRLVDGTRVDWRNRTHFYALCARLMRRILVDRARERHADKRGGGARLVPLADAAGAVAARDADLLALEEALGRLAESDRRKAQVVELRYFGGLTVEETADALGLSPETVKRDWKVARLWLAKRLMSDPRTVRRAAADAQAGQDD